MRDLSITSGSRTPSSTSVLFAAAAVALAVGSTPVHAQAPAPESAAAPASTPAQAPLAFTLSGFLTAAAGRVLGGTHVPEVDRGYRCPCYIADFAQGAVYESGRTRFAPDSKLGLQAHVGSGDGRFGLTGQVVSRAAQGGDVGLEWLYGTAQLDSRWTLQVGRKRLPLFAYSEVQDVGYAIPWAHLPGQLYGWEAVNYNGVNLQFRDDVGGWLGTINLLAGSETVRDAGFWKIYNGKQSRTDAKWTDIVGAEARLSRDGYEMRYVYLQSNTRNRIVSDGDSGDTAYTEPAKQRIHGLGFSADLGPWILRAEFQAIDRMEDYGRDRGQLYAVGYRHGAWTPLLSYARYRQWTHPGTLPAEGHLTWSFVLRYDIDQGSAIKLQFDRWRDRSAAGFESMHGHARLIMLAYDRVF